MTFCRSLKGAERLLEATGSYTTKVPSVIYLISVHPGVPTSEFFFTLKVNCIFAIIALICINILVLKGTVHY